VRLRLPLSFSRLPRSHFFINKVYVYISFYSTRSVRVLDLSTTDAPKIGLSRRICMHVRAARAFLPSFSCTLSRSPPCLLSLSLLPSLSVSPARPSCRGIHAVICSLEPAVPPRVSTDICFIVFRVLFEINNTNQAIPPPIPRLLFSYFIRGTARRAAFNLARSRPRLRSDPGYRSRNQTDDTHFRFFREQTERQVFRELISIELGLTLFDRAVSCGSSRG